jgi:LuxR family maltose regulon positive regulatory protein
MENYSSIIQTKLNRPPLPRDLVRRSRLTEWMEQNQECPLTLVSAPPGYGKSTLISCWIESADRPAAWLSLDERDNELGSFLSYFLAATQTIFPLALPETEALLMVAPLPPVSAISKILINELNQIEKPFIIVLDDYHIIDNPSIHELLNELLLHPPRNMHMVLGTRADSSLPLITLRANGKVTEIRVQDLRFNQEETRQLLQMLTGITIDQADIAEIDAHAEGWVTGLRLTVLAMQHRIGRGSFKEEITANNRYVTEYLLNEILAKKETRFSDCMLKISILDRFRADLCEAVCFNNMNSIDVGSEKPEFNGVQFLESLLASNLFVIPLDDQREWFRYHHLFQEFLQQEMVSNFSSEKIRDLHAAAGQWYAHHNLIEEALIHLLAARDTAAAINLVAKHRPRMMNDNQWPRMERWLNLFSPEVIESSAELWMLKTWLAYHHGLWSELPAYLEQLAEIFAHVPAQGTANKLAGEINSLSSMIAYHAGDTDQAISMARQALELLPDDFWSARVLSRTYLSISLLLSGDASGGYHSIYDTFQEEKVQSKHFKATLLLTACYFHWISADLRAAAQAAKRSIEICTEMDYQSILGYGKYNLGRVHYQRDELTEAEKLFTNIVASPYQNFGECYTSSACGLVMTYQAQGRAAKARQITDETIAFLLETGNTTQLPFALALQAELDLMQGRLSSASQWAEKLNTIPPMVPMAGFIEPNLTLIKVWLAENSLLSQNNAAKLLHQIREYLMGIHHTRFLIETLALQAMWQDAVGDEHTALDTLEESLKLAQPGGFIRLFVDLGPQMLVLLSRLRGSQDLQGYINQIRSTFVKGQGQSPALIVEDITKPLTIRELEILELLHERLTNKEIAVRLVIAPGTVKAHTIRIYKKLAVNDRREAVQTAIMLGILQPT